jgi:SAM-dependent methyltransferase
VSTALVPSRGAPFPLVCAACRAPLSDDLTACTQCAQRYPRHDATLLDLCVTEDRINVATEAAYKMYSRFYAPIALLVYWIVWRGNFSRHVAFFREVVDHDAHVVDVATGEGTLTRMALLKKKHKRAAKVLGLDISGDMLRKATRKLPAKDALLMRADVQQLPFPDRSVRAMTCFGGLNSFPSGAVALKEMARVLAADGRLRGSVLLLPASAWRANLVRKWIREGYQTEVVTQETLEAWVAAAGLTFSQRERHGDVILFELAHPR